MSPNANLKALIQLLPSSCGVYLFYSSKEDVVPLYIGKSIDIKKRVLSHFYQAEKTLKESKLMRRVQHITYQETAGEIGALLLEASLVKQFQPLYNRKLRRCSQLCYFSVINSQPYVTLECKRTCVEKLELNVTTVGLFTTQRQAINHLRDISKKDELCPIILGLEKGKGPCFNYQLGYCRGACIGKESPDAFNQRLMSALKEFKHVSWPYSGVVALVEQCAQKPMKDVHYLYQWRYISTMSLPVTKKIQSPLSSEAIAFDRDHYKIIRHALTNIDRYDISLHELMT